MDELPLKFRLKPNRADQAIHASGDGFGMGYDFSVYFKSTVKGFEDTPIDGGVFEGDMWDVYGEGCYDSGKYNPKQYGHNILSQTDDIWVEISNYQIWHIVPSSIQHTAPKNPDNAEMRKTIYEPDIVYKDGQYQYYEDNYGYYEI